MSGPVADRADAALDRLPDAAVRIGRALQPVFEAFDRAEPVSELARRAGGFAEDPPVVGVRAVAGAYGLRTAVRRCGRDQLAGLPAPYVAFPGGRPVGVGTGADRAGVPAPAAAEAGEVTVVTFRPGREFLRDDAALSSAAVLGRRLRVARSGFVLAILAGVLLALPTVVVAGLAKAFVNKYLVDGSAQWLTAVLIAFVLAAVLQAGLGALQQSAMTRMSRKMSITMSADYLWHLLRLPISHFVARPAGDLGFLMGLNDRTATHLGRRLSTALMSLVVAVICGVFLARFSGLLTVVVLTLWIASFVAVQLLSRRLAPVAREFTAAQAATMGTATGGISSIESLKANGAEEALFARWAGSHTRALGLEQRMGLLNTSLAALPNLSILLMTTAVIGVGGAQVIAGEITLGDLVGFQALLHPFLTATSQVLGATSLLRKVISDCRTLDQTYRLSIDTGSAASESIGPADGAGMLTGAVETRGLTFGYRLGEPTVVTDLDLRLEPGARVALVGGSGSGKSTVARLITGQFEPWSGQILFDGRPRHAHHPASLAHSIAFVQQDVYLFDGTVSDNLTLWDPTVPESDVVRAARDACIHDEISAFPGGYGAHILEGGRNLSGGQRQRMEIARALAGNPRVLVLDEATSALDSVTEAIVDANLRRRGCTCLIVAHRLSTIRDCDEIVVLEHGRVVERGTHEGLLAVDGAYARLVGDMPQ